ncbi:MAG: nitrous oxide-stimulated promoter family protein [Candidatus Thorarchaeota archaeon]|nr:MAG: nitrous oxide-stimulated promoter family protein [Candidatus Thorarchaeota archaeon]
MSIERFGSVIESEKSGIAQMIHLFCEKHQSPRRVLYDECQELLTYAHERLEHCRFGEERPTCRKCPAHCYRPAMRESVRAVMRFGGPRFFFHALMRWILHAIRDRKKVQTAQRSLEKKKE